MTLATPRFHVAAPLQPADDWPLPAGAARHVQVLRLQPGSPLRLFDGRGGEWPATVRRIGRSEVTVTVGSRLDIDRELAVAVTLAIGMPANERMDALVEKATELGVAAIQPLICERSVLRLAGERADKKVAHWQAVAVAACEQSGRNRVPPVRPVRSLREWLAGRHPAEADAEADAHRADALSTRWMLSLRDAEPVAAQPPVGQNRVICLSGPEGGLTPAEEDAAGACGYRPVSLGPRVLRADTAPLAVLAILGVLGGSRGSRVFGVKGSP